MLGLYIEPNTRTGLVYNVYFPFVTRHHTLPERDRIDDMHQPPVAFLAATVWTYGVASGVATSVFGGGEGQEFRHDVMYD